MAPDAFDEDDDARAALDEEAAASTPASVWLEESSRARAWANLLSPGLPRHRDALGDGLAPRPEVRARLRAHVSSLGPPHTLVLTGPEGSGKTTELAVLADWLRRGGREDPLYDDRFDDDAARDGAPGERARPPPTLETGTGTNEALFQTPSGSSASKNQHDGEPPFVLAHTFADASFPQDTAHFLEKACARLKIAFGIAAPLPRDAADLPECFVKFLETAALHRKVVVIVDACESARCAPYAGVGAVAVAGLDPRENAPAEFFLEEEERKQKRVSRDASSNDDASSVEGGDDGTRAFSTSNAHLADLREHFRWLPQSPPLAVRFVLACREAASEGTENANAEALVARAIQSGAPASRASYAMPPLTVEQTRAVLASATPAPLGEPNGQMFKNSASALERGHHHCLETAAVVNAAERNGATPLFARVASPFVAGLCAATKHSAWIAAGGEATTTNEEDEFSGVFGEGLRSGSESGGGAKEKERRAERVVVPPAVAAAVRASAGTAFGLVHGRLGAFERRADFEPRTLRAVCLAFAVARFGVTEREARRLARRIVDDETARRNAAFPDSPSASPFADDAFDAALRALRPWLAPWTTRASWAAERVPFEGDEDLFDAESFHRARKKEKRGADEEASRKDAFRFGDGGSDGRDSAGAEDDDDVPLTFRDAPTRACVLRRYAPPHARSALDGESVRRRLHADIAAFFLEEKGDDAGEEEKNKVEKKRVFFRLSRRLTRAAAWHCSAAEDYASLSALIGGSPGAVAAFAKPGLRSELAVLLANGAGSAPSPTTSLISTAVAERARAWLDMSEEDETETETDLSAVRERSRRMAAHSGRYAGCCLALASVFCWLKTPESALTALAAATERFGPPRGRSGVTCALALARCEALCLMTSRSKRWFERSFQGASRFDDASGDAFFFGAGGSDGRDSDGAADDDDACPTVDVDGRATRIDSALPKLAKDASAACETFAAASSGDFSGVFPSPWRETLFECSAFGSALRSPPTLAALAASARVDVVSVLPYSAGAVGGKEWVEKEKTLFDARLEEIRAWRRAALATATPRVSRALTTVLDRRSPADSLVASRVSDTAARGLSFEREEDAAFGADDNHGFPRFPEASRVSLVSPTHEVLGLLDALRRRRDAFDPRSSPEDARDASDVFVAVAAALLGDDHPETGAAKTVAAEAAARAVVDGGFGGFESEMFGEYVDGDGSLKEPESRGKEEEDHYSSQITTLIAWSKPAYAFAERFYGARSLPAARAAWCVAEGVRRRVSSGADGSYFGDGAFTPRRSSAKFGRVSAGGAGARAARPMYAQALGATVATLGPAHEGAGETFIAAGALSRSERRAEEARALIEEGARVARSNAAAAEAERDALVAAGFEALEAFSLKNAHRDVLERVRLGSETCVAAAERRLRVAERRAGRGFAKLSLLARDDGDASGAEVLLRRALACFERALGPGCGACAPLLAALGRVATDRGHSETAEACFRHALGVDEAAARKTRGFRTDGHSVSLTSRSNIVFAHPRSASHLASIAWSRARAKGLSQAEVLLHAALDAAASAAAVETAARDALEILNQPEAADDADDERASLAFAASDPGEILNALGLMYSHQGRFEEAAQRFERAIALGAARARAAARDADAYEQLVTEATFSSDGSERSSQTAFASTFDQTSQRKRKIDRRTKLVASADAARRWRDASALTSAALANLGVLRFRTSSARDVARGGGCASFFHRAWTYAANNPDLGPSHPHTAWAYAWFEVCGGSESVCSDAGKAVDSMLDATLKGEWGGFNVRSKAGTGTPAFRELFETAWGSLVGETSASIADGGRRDAGLVVEPCAVANDATPRKVPVLAELGSFADSPLRGSGVFSFREKTSAGDSGGGAMTKTKTKTLAAKPPAVSVALEHHRPASVAIASWRLFWSETDVAHAVRLDHLDVDLALAAVVDDVADGAVGKLSEKKTTVFPSSEKRRDEARAKAFAAAALSAARAAANASSFLFDDSVWARRCDGGDGRTLDARLGETGTRRDGDGDGDAFEDAFEDERRAVDDEDSVSVRGDGDPGDGDPGDLGDGDSSVEDGVPGGTAASARLAADVPADPADSALVAQSFVVALHAETEAEKSANPENEFLEHYRAQLAARLMRSKEESEWEATKTRVENASSRETMALIVRDGDLVGMAEAIGVVEGDDRGETNDDRREIVSTRVSSIAGTRTAVDAARAFFVDSSFEAGAPRDAMASTKNRKGKEDDDGRLEEPFLWAPGEAERAAAKKMALEDARHAAAVARDEARREMLTAQRESLARGALRRSGGNETSSTETERARVSVDRHDGDGARTAEAARAAVEAASFAVRVASEALKSGGDVASRADAVAAATRAARDFALARSSRDRVRSSRPSTASKLEAFKRRRSRDAEKETPTRFLSRPGTARSPPFAIGFATRDENDDVVTSDGRLDLEPSRSRDDDFAYAEPPENLNLARASSSAYGPYLNGSAPAPSASPFVGRRGRASEFVSIRDSREKRDVRTGEDVTRRVSIPMSSNVSDEVVSVPVSRLLSWVDRGLAVRDSAGVRGSGFRESTDREALPRSPADREGGGQLSSAHPRLGCDSDGETFDAEFVEEGDASVFAKESASGDVRVAPRGGGDFDARDFTDARTSSKIGAMLAEERAFRTHNASARLLADLSAARGARRLRESVDATPKSKAFFSAAKSNASRARPASAAVATATAAEPRRPTLASRRPSSAAGFAADAPEDERVWKARMRARVEERRRKLFGVGGGTK
jgi:tetratricopeptide (TPR) repeat protein